MKKIIMALTVSVGLLAPAYLSAQDRDDHHDRDDHNAKRYYDRHHKDYHQWNGNEDQAWRIYWQQQHRPYVDWDRANARQQQAYWDWRHNHSDSLLQINIGH